ncbi:hypothetical protein J3Q64DRAFT_1328312 [Phycomyces blakesleeanus]|uniref:Uncharacterized protein n=2 Tax=Phycomyces blakesleeanus TaxID=4837 RepID=A0A167R1J9_PHYB8|nr:hypothetical protein PHYBLDRAFT_61690 [Phycomyces blakesleeanus NRRL 1555(-)]OAD80638.1 hypothetical protein PHYBLDRAFT_61690 [Phycomyces blakesleeanus NRRL 1555(-)]|eukprot:XP_018298678.1 hypothetical protein PHYBLDRAFT_61690 [Phycomyces blakesleeanus NRRL 1555(-)]
MPRQTRQKRAAQTRMRKVQNKYGIHRPSTRIIEEPTCSADKPLLNDDKDLSIHAKIANPTFERDSTENVELLKTITGDKPMITPEPIITAIEVETATSITATTQYTRVEGLPFLTEHKHMDATKHLPCKLDEKTSSNEGNSEYVPEQDQLSFVSPDISSGVLQAEPSTNQQKVKSEDQLGLKIGAVRKTRETYKKNSRTTLWRRRKAALLAMSKSDTSAESKECNLSIPNQQPECSETDKLANREKIEKKIEREKKKKEKEEKKKNELNFFQDAYTKLDEKALAANASAISVPNSGEPYESHKHLAVKQYIQFRLQGMKKMAASERAAKNVWPTSSTYRPASIRRWANEYLNSGKISISRQGKHAKRKPLTKSTDEKTETCEES